MTALSSVCLDRPEPTSPSAVEAENKDEFVMVKVIVSSETLPWRLLLLQQDLLAPSRVGYIFSPRRDHVVAQDWKMCFARASSLGMTA